MDMLFFADKFSGAATVTFSTDILLTFFAASTAQPIVDKTENITTRKQIFRREFVGKIIRGIKFFSEV